MPGALEDSLMQFGLDDRPHNGFLAFGVGRVGHLAGPHPGGRATQVRVGGAAPEHGDHLYRLDAPAVPGGGFPLLGPGQFPVGVGAAVAIFARVVVDGAGARRKAAFVCSRIRRTTGSSRLTARRNSSTRSGHWRAPS